MDVLAQMVCRLIRKKQHLERDFTCRKDSGGKKKVDVLVDILYRQQVFFFFVFESFCVIIQIKGFPPVFVVDWSVFSDHINLKHSFWSSKADSSLFL